MDVHGRKDAAVLVPLYADATGELHAVFTRRRDDLRRHAGEISFPGGRRDDGEAPAARPRCARPRRRSACRDRRRVVGALEPTPTFVTNYAIYPFVGLIEPGFAWVLQEAEVAAVLELSLADLRAGYGRAAAGAAGDPVPHRHLRARGHLVWGATARIVHDLLDR